MVNQPAAAGQQQRLYRGLETPSGYVAGGCPPQAENHLSEYCSMRPIDASIACSCPVEHLRAGGEACVRSLKRPLLSLAQALKGESAAAEPGTGRESQRPAVLQALRCGAKVVTPGRKHPSIGTPAEGTGIPCR